MRSEADLIKVRASLYTIIDLDWERIESDPLWEEVCLIFDISNPDLKREALFKYIGLYLSRERLFAERFMPSSNGPSDLFITDMTEVL